MRRFSVLLAFCLAGCVGTNPDWDGPDRGGASQAEGDAETADGEAESGSDGTATTDGSSPSDTGDAPVCDEGEVMCADECTDIASDKHACGSDCVDCTIEFGNDARCRDGVCGPKEE